MSETFFTDEEISCVVRYRKIVQFARGLDVNVDRNWIGPGVAFQKLLYVAQVSDDDTVDSMIADELISQTSTGSIVDGITGLEAAQVGVAYSWDFASHIGEGAPALVEFLMTGGTLPSGLTYDDQTMTISGTPAAATEGAYVLEFTGLDAANITGLTIVSLNVLAAAP